jgi:hypothetical protein
MQAAHDATGYAGPGSKVWMLIAVFASILWWAATLWLVLLAMACSAVLVMLHVSKAAITNLLLRTPSVEVAWVPSSGQLCPPACLDVSYLGSYLKFSYAQSCVCDRAALSRAAAAFGDAYAMAPPATAGVWVMFLAALVVLAALASQYAHTDREREYIGRLTASNKQFISV